MSIPLASLRKQCDLQAMSEGRFAVTVAQMARYSGHHKAKIAGQSYHIEAVNPHNPDMTRSHPIQNAIQICVATPSHILWRHAVPGPSGQVSGFELREVGQ
jgi:hypothetical protein